MFNFGKNLKISSFIASLVLLVGHWFPWSFFLGGRTLPRIPSYMYGTLTLWGSLTLYHQLSDHKEYSPLTFFKLICLSGGSVIAAYALDEVAKMTARANSK